MSDTSSLTIVTVSSAAPAERRVPSCVCTWGRRRWRSTTSSASSSQSSFCQGGRSVSTLLYPRLSVNRRLRLGTGWEPPIRGSEMFERPPRPNLTDFFQFFCKKHMSHPFPWWNFFCGVQKIFLPPQMGHFFGGTDTFPKLRGRAVRGPLLYINLYALGST